MDYREKKALERDKKILEEKLKSRDAKAKYISGDLKENFGVNKTYEGPTPNGEYFEDIVKKTQGPKAPNKIEELGNLEDFNNNKSKFFNDHNLDEIATSDIPKARQGYLNDLKKAIGSGDDEMLADLIRNRDPLAVRHEISTALGQHVKQNYDNPLNAFKDKHILEQVPVEVTQLPKGVAAQYSLDKNKIYMPKSVSDLDERGTGTLLHEFGHAKDWLINKLKGINLNMNDDVLKGSGLQAAEKAFGNHHAGGFFEKQALNKLMNGGKLAIPALALGASLYSTGSNAAEAGSKALSGDLPGAASKALDAGLSAGQVLDPTGVVSAVSQIKDRLAMPTKEGVAASMQDINNAAHTQLGDYSGEDFSEAVNDSRIAKPNPTRLEDLKAVTDPVAEEYRSNQLLKNKLYGK